MQDVKAGSVSINREDCSSAEVAPFGGGAEECLAEQHQIAFGKCAVAVGVVGAGRLREVVKVGVTGSVRADFKNGADGVGPAGGRGAVEHAA